MSFSFHLRARTIAAAAALAAIEMDRVVQAQPAHSADRDQVLAGVQNQLGVIAPAADGSHVVLIVHGSLSWRGSYDHTARQPGEGYAITAANMGVNAYLVPEDAVGDHLPVLREAPEA